MSAPSSARYTSLVCRLGLLLAQSDAHTHPGRLVVLRFKVSLHHQLARCRQHSKWPRFSESNDEAVCIHSPGRLFSHFHLQAQTNAHTPSIQYVCHVKPDLHIRGSVLVADISLSVNRFGSYAQTDAGGAAVGHCRAGS